MNIDDRNPKLTLNRSSSAPLLLTSLAFLLGAFSFFILYLGDTPWDLIWQGVVERLTGSSQRWNTLLDERLPRLIVVISTGASLAVAGSVTQALFRNPLASPSILGIPFGGSLCVLFTFIAGWNIHYPFAIPLAAIAGCMATLVLVSLFSLHNGKIEMSTIILNGIAITTVMMAIQKVVLYVLRDDWFLMQTLMEWEAGSTVDRTWTHVHMQLPLTLIGLTGCWSNARELNILALGEDEALNLGMDSQKTRWRLFFYVALLTGGVLAAVGIIAFFGLLLPHIFRKLHGPDNVTLIPLCAVGGATLLAGLEVALRATGTYLFTIGNISALLGGLFFLGLLFRKKPKYQLL